MQKTYNFTKAVDFTTSKIIDSNVLDQVLIIVPCYNEEHNIGKAIKNLLNDYNYNFLVIDDCSTDKSLEIIKSNRWNYIHNETNLGLSRSFREGIKYAIKNGYKFVVQYDGDGQHNAKDIAMMIYFALKGYDIVVSSRYYSSHNLTKDKIIAHKLLRLLIRVKTHQLISDPTCGLRLYNWIAMQHYVNNKKLEVEPSTIAYLVARKKLKIKEIPTTVFLRENGQGIFDCRKHAFRYMCKQLLNVTFFFFLYSKEKTSSGDH